MLIIAITLTFPVIMTKSDSNDEYNIQRLQDTILRQIVTVQYHSFVINYGTQLFTRMSRGAVHSPGASQAR